MTAVLMGGFVTKLFEIWARNLRHRQIYLFPLAYMFRSKWIEPFNTSSRKQNREMRSVGCALFGYISLFENINILLVSSLGQTTLDAPLNQ